MTSMDTPDWAWARRLKTLIEDTPLEPTLMEALNPLARFFGAQSNPLFVDLGELEDVVCNTRRDWRSASKLQLLGLPVSFEESALAIHVYTLHDPCIYKVITHVMASPDRYAEGRGISEALNACAPYIRFLNEALQRLPGCFVYQGPVYRGVKVVYPSLDRHDPKAHFKTGATILWYEFKSTSTNQEVMSNPCFCGHQAGPRTIFCANAIQGYRIADFSKFPSEAEVLFPPLTQLCITDATKLIIDPMETRNLRKSGHPDVISLKQIVNPEV